MVIYKAYVDGSFHNGKIGYGAVILKNDESVKEIYGRIFDGDFAKHRQVGGELLAVIKVLEWCEEKDIRNISIYYDYTGIKEWATDSWKANKDATKKYKKFIKQSKVSVKWIKVRAHSGDKFNEIADALALKGTKIQQSPTKEISPNKKNENEFLYKIEDLLRKRKYGYMMRNFGKYIRFNIFKNEESYGHFDLYNSNNEYFPILLEIEEDKREEIIDLISSL